MLKNKKINGLAFLMFVVFFCMAAQLGRRALPKMLVIGDSISFQYRPCLNDSISGIVDLHWLGLGDGKWDIITFNYGLHDLKFDTYTLPIDPDKYKQYCSPQEYKLNLRCIIERLRKTGARLVWVTMTPGKGDTEGTRIPGDHEVFNQFSAEVLKDYPEILVIDLYRSNMANLYQQDAVHFAGNQGGKERAASIITRTVKIILEQNARNSRTPKLFSQNSEGGIIESQLDQVSNNGTWTNHWKSDFVSENDRITERVGSYYKNNTWGNAYKYTWTHNSDGKITQKDHQLWRKGAWANYKKEELAIDASGNVKEEIWSECWQNKWEPAWKFNYTYDSDNAPLTRDSYIYIDKKWQKNLEIKFVNNSGKITEKTVSAKLGNNFTERYKFKYTHDDKGRITKVYSERYCFSKWFKSSEYTTTFTATSFTTSFKGYFEGKTTWTEIYKIDGKYDGNNNVTASAYKEKLVGLTSNTPALLENSFKYDSENNLTEKNVTIAIGNSSTKKWSSTPSMKTIYTYGESSVKKGFNKSKQQLSISSVTSQNISFSIPSEGRYSLSVYTMSGKRIMSINNRRYSPGFYNVFGMAKMLANRSV